jgi:hypothetical protein
MNETSLDRLKAAFDDWRSKKRHPREAIPGALLARARRAARHHGPAAVARVTKVDRTRLRTARASRHAGPPGVAQPPAFSRVELTPPAMAVRPFAEVETATGAKLRFFAQTDELLGLLSSLCGTGGAQ